MKEKISSTIILLLAFGLMLSRLQFTGSYTDVSNRGIASKIDSDMITTSCYIIGMDNNTGVLKRMKAPIYKIDTVSGNGILDSIVMPHNLHHIPTYYNIIPISKDAKDISWITADTQNIVAHYEIGMGAGTNNLIYNTIIIP